MDSYYKKTSNSIFPNSTRGFHNKNYSNIFQKDQKEKEKDLNKDSNKEKDLYNNNPNFNSTQKEKKFNQKSPNNSNNLNSNYSKLTELLESVTNPQNNHKNIPGLITVNPKSFLMDHNILSNPFRFYEDAKFSTKSYGNIIAYGVNTNQGQVRNYNEDRVSIILNVIKPASRKNENWPKVSFFGIYDGHGGTKCSDFLKENLHHYVNEDKLIQNFL